MTPDGSFAFPIDNAAIREPARGVMEGHVQRPDTRPIEDPAEITKIMLAKQGASTHDPSGPTAHT